jgi:glutathione S-transferase
MRCHFSPRAYAVSPHSVARRDSLPLCLGRIDARAMVAADGADNRSINPKGYVPMREIEAGIRLAADPAIAQCLADQSSTRQYPLK